MLWVLVMEMLTSLEARVGEHLQYNVSIEILNSSTQVSYLFFCHSSGPKFNSAIRVKIGLPHSIKLRFLTFLFFIASLMGFV